MKYKRYLTLLLVILVLVLGVTALTSAQNIPTVTYTVQPGDSLSKIARQYCTTWQEIYDMNRGIIGDDPSKLEPGTVIYIIPRCGGQPPQCEVTDSGPRMYANGTVNGNVYTAAWGDTLYSIGLRFGVPWQEIAEINGVDKVVSGQQLLIPGLCQAPPAGQSTISIISPPNGASLTSNFDVSGNGAGLFEGNVVVSVKDGNGVIIAQQVATLQGQNVGTGGPGVWSVSFTGVVGQPQSNGTIEAFSPGSPAYDSINIWFSGQ